MLESKSSALPLGYTAAGVWWLREDSNLLHPAYETDVLPVELRSHMQSQVCICNLKIASGGVTPGN
jgi:hypothetical protein